jgi:PhoH-like ATPase
MNHTSPARTAARPSRVEVRAPTRVKESPVNQGSSPTKRTYILDTNVLLYDPHALEVFEEHDIVIPMTVIEEIDRFKRDINETGRNARQTSRMLDDLRQQGSLKAGVTLPGGGRLRVDFAVEDDDIPITWGADSNDNKILRTAVRLHGQLNGDVALVTRDTNMRLKCDALGVVAEDYENAHLAVDEQWSGVVERWVPPEVVASVWAEGELKTDLLGDLYPNTFAVLRSAADDNQTAMVRVKAGGFKLVPRHKEGAWGVFARNKEQLFALELLLDPDVQLVTLNGMAGTGKTLLAIAAGPAPGRGRALPQDAGQPAHLSARARHRVPCRATSERS